VLALHLRPGAREWFLGWLGREHPELVARYRELYGRGAYVPAEYRGWLARRVAPLLARHGLDRQAGGVARGVSGAAAEPQRPTGLPGDDEGSFPAGSLPEVPPGPAGRTKHEVAPRARAETRDPGPEQLTLL
jgi:hypothetical protein